ncbi:MAG TPA: type II secretion system F family protein [bacterium]|nr:type II secretion system F family protein [bacterium]
MGRYFYVARDFSGKRKEGIIEANSDSDAVVNLRRQNLIPIEVHFIGEKGLSSIIATEKRVRGRVSLTELAVFSRQFATMLDAGVPIIDILDDLSKQTTNKYFGYVLSKIRRDIQEGSNFSMALSKHPKVFSPLYIALVRSGEESGNLPSVMEEIASYLEDQIMLLRKVRQAVSYPSVIIAFFIGVVSFVFLFLIPRFQQIFKSFGAKLPPLTMAVLNTSQFFVKFLPFIIGFLFLMWIFFLIYRRTPTGRKHIDTLKLKFPFFGKLMTKISLARFARSLSTLLGGGVSIAMALDIVADTAGNVIIGNIIRKVRKGVIEGKVLGEEMRKYPIFPPMLVRMVSVGEETGRMEDMLNRVSKFFRDEVDATLNILTSILEPVLIIGLGIIVGIVVLAIYLPIFKLASTIR